MKNPEVFQGEKYLKSNKDYFEGWYFKNTTQSTDTPNTGISFIPGININNKSAKAFVQVITDTSSYFVDYPIKSFKFQSNPFSIQIGKNSFSKEGIHINLKDTKQNLNISGDIRYTNSKNINTNLLNPNIMGPFSYVPAMECNHAILSMQNKSHGALKINNHKISFENSTGYIEKDWGYSFPKSYIWCQGNNFTNKSASFMCSIADIDHNFFHFKGLICVLIIENQEFKFTTYNNAKIVKFSITNDNVDITLKKGSYTLNINSKCNTAQKLSAPVKGNMSKDIYETISATISVTLKKQNEILFTDTSSDCGLEIVL